MSACRIWAERPISAPLNGNNNETSQHAFFTRRRFSGAFFIYLMENKRGNYGIAFGMNRVLFLSCVRFTERLPHAVGKIIDPAAGVEPPDTDEQFEEFLQGH